MRSSRNPLPAIRISRSFAPLLCSCRAGLKVLAHLCASTGVQGLFDPISTKKCLENYFQTHRTRETSISFHPSLWNMHQSSIETDTLQNRRGGLLARGQPPGLPSQLSPMAIDHSSPLQQQGLPQIHTAFPFPFDLFSFFPFTGKTGSTPEYSTPETKCKNILLFYFS